MVADFFRGRVALKWREPPRLGCKFQLVEVKPTAFRLHQVGEAKGDRYRLVAFARCKNLRRERGARNAPMLGRVGCRFSDESQVSGRVEARRQERQEVVARVECPRNRTFVEKEEAVAQEEIVALAASQLKAIAARLEVSNQRITLQTVDPRIEVEGGVALAEDEGIDSLVARQCVNLARSRRNRARLDPH